MDDVTYYTDAEGKTRCCCCAGDEAGHDTDCPHFKGAAPEPREERVAELEWALGWGAEKFNHMRFMQ